MYLHLNIHRVIDKQGREQTLFDADFVPAQLVNSLASFF
jgi:hypothetical protein